MELYFSIRDVSWALSIDSTNIWHPYTCITNPHTLLNIFLHAEGVLSLIMARLSMVSRHGECAFMGTYLAQFPTINRALPANNRTRMRSYPLMFGDSTKTTGHGLGALLGYATHKFLLNLIRDRIAVHT